MIPRRLWKSVRGHSSEEAKLARILHQLPANEAAAVRMDLHILPSDASLEDVAYLALRKAGKRDRAARKIIRAACKD